VLGTQIDSLSIKLNENTTNNERSWSKIRGSDKEKVLCNTSHSKSRKCKRKYLLGPNRRGAPLTARTRRDLHPKRPIYALIFLYNHRAIGWSDPECTRHGAQARGVHDRRDLTQRGSEGNDGPRQRGQNGFAQGMFDPNNGGREMLQSLPLRITSKAGLPKIYAPTPNV